MGVERADPAALGELGGPDDVASQHVDSRGVGGAEGGRVVAVLKVGLGGEGVDLDPDLGMTGFEAVGELAEGRDGARISPDGPTEGDGPVEVAAGGQKRRCEAQQEEGAGHASASRRA
ncbi:hypothetical protein D3C72_2118890 [compost metagenome]